MSNIAPNVVPFPIGLPEGARLPGNRRALARKAGPVTMISTSQRLVAAARGFADASAAHAAQLGMPDLVGMAAEAELLAEQIVERLTEAQEPRRRR